MYCQAEQNGNCGTAPGLRVPMTAGRRVIRHRRLGAAPRLRQKNDETEQSRGLGRFQTSLWRNIMDENRLTGTARNLGGKVQEGFGRVTGDTQTQAEGIANQVTGAAQDLYGRARDGASDAADATVTAAASFEKLLRNPIENQPYTTAAVALGLGWLLGRMHRPL